LQLANAIRSPVIATQTDVEIARSALEKCKPVLFLAVFVDNLSASFLPQLIRGYADTAQVHPFMASVAFMAYFICFAVVLVPAGKLAQRIGAKPLLVGGAVLIAVGLAILVATGDFGLVVLARVLQGLGQGILFIGVQTMILTVARKGGTQTKGNAITVYNFNAGMMAGMAIGSLLVLYMGSTGVFVFALVATVALAAYIAAVVPQMIAPEETTTAHKGGAILQALSSFEFLRALFGVGIPTKIVMTGVIMFGMPILLSTMAFESDEIGQIIMCYAIGVLLANHFISNVVSTRQGIDQILNRGMLLGAFGLLVIGGTGLFAEQWARDHAIIMTMLMMVGVMAVGLGHGALNAPIVTYVANSAIAQRMGIVTTTSIYRVLERAGHVVGPMLVGQLLLFSDQKVSLIGWIGAALLAITVLFQLSHRAARNSTHWTT
jgi:MFS family permease